MSDFDMRFGGIGRLYGEAGLRRLRAAHVAIVGVGGVGSWTAEALARSGVGALTLIDLDDVCVTNTNRQIHALTDTVGRSKIEVMAARIRAISPDCALHLEHDFLTPTSVERLFAPGFDFVVDAIDQFRNKCVIALWAQERGVPLIVCGGAGGRRDPGAVVATDLTKSHGDRLLAKVRKELRQKHGFKRRGAWGIPCVYSSEPPRFPTADGGVCESRHEAADNLKLDCASGFGTATFVTGTFGFVAASVVVNQLVRGREHAGGPGQ